MAGLSGAQIQHKRKASYLHARPIAHNPPRCPVVGHSRPAWGSSEGDNIVLKVINVGNVPVMGTAVPSNRRGTRCVLVVLTALVIGALLEGFGKCRSISNHFPIKEKLLEHSTKIARGSFISNDNGRKVSYCLHQCPLLDFCVMCFPYLDLGILNNALFLLRGARFGF